jgi:NitT/TauT family transport system substrate-binding protein
MNRRPRPLPLLLLLLLVLATLPAVGGGKARAQESTPTALSCQPPRSAPLATQPAAAPAPSSPAVGERTAITVGFVPISIYAPVFVAQEKGYFAEQGLAVTLEPLAGGSDLVALTASGQFQAATAGAGPAFWNAAATGLPIAIVAPGHREGVPVATPLMISKEACESGAITGVADLAGKRVSVNARGATEYWLSQALGTAGLGLDDVELQTIPFPEAVVALGSGGLDAAMIGEPLATKAEQDGIAVRLATDFPVQDVLPTVLVANSDFAAENPAAVQGLVTAYLKASRDLAGGGFRDPANLAIIEQYTGVPAALIGQAVPPVYAVDGELDPAALGALQTFFRERGQLEYETDLDPASLIDRSFLDAALAELGPASGE